MGEKTVISPTTSKSGHKSKAVRANRNATVEFGSLT